MQIITSFSFAFGILGILVAHKGVYYGIGVFVLLMIILGIVMLLYTSFNYVTTEKVVDIGPIQINKEVNHPIKWSPIIGIILAVGGVVLIVVGTKKEA